jgi:dolichol-phosphate mannosyltransferase
MTRLRRGARLASIALRSVGAAVVIGRLAGAARPAPPVRPTSTPTQSISVVVPARNEATRIRPLLDTVVGAPGVDEVLVVDDQSTDGTADVASGAGATVIAGRPLPDGWAGKAWALHQGVEAARSDWVVTLDADTRPDPTLPTALVARAIAEHLDLVTVGGRFECPTPGSRWLHPAMLTTLVYRFGPPGVPARDPRRTMANGQCMAFERRRFLALGGIALVRDEIVEDIALARRIATDGGAVGFLDGSEELTVRMFETAADVWHGWGRSLALPGVERPARQLAELSVIVMAQAVPIPRLLTGRGDAIDVVLALVRLGTLVGTRRAYTRTGAAYWLSPFADPLAALAIARGVARRRRQTWRGRTYS